MLAVLVRHIYSALKLFLLARFLLGLDLIPDALITALREDLAKRYFYNKPQFLPGADFVASCGGVMVEPKTALR